MIELETFDKARMLIRIATGEEYGDGYIVTDLVSGYAEPGYGYPSPNDAVIVFGNWNPKRFPRNDDPPLTKAESLPSRLASALEKIGAECEWLDEWAQCGVCYRAIRTQGDSYSWTMFGAWHNECEIVCADCMRADPEPYLAEFVNDPSRAVTWISGRELEAIGFVQWEADDPHSYENGWHPGQNDDPKQIMREITLQLDDIDGSEIPESTAVMSSAREIVFLIDSVGQFDMRFSAYVREQKEED